ncbi:MAG: DUF1501 domain-containing protein [Akkermansiaceae bacterium]|nr:DUF1501 domain-containing protein [Akkermansiaceae bacterium]
MKTEFQLPYISRRNFLQKAVPAAVGATVLSNTIRDLRILNSAMAQEPIPTDYKALVCVFLNGGNDSNNMIIPTLPSEWQNYADLRTPVLAIPNTDGSGSTILGVTSKNGMPGFPSSDGRTYGFHPAMPQIQTLFNAGVVAPVFNVGTLSFPMTKTQYSAGSVPRPPQLFSHSDQQLQWQTSLSDQAYTSGWAGRLADLFTQPADVNAGGQISMAVTLAGSNIFQVGTANAAAQYAITTGGAVSLSSSFNAGRRPILQSILDIDKTDANLQTAAYAGVLDHAIAQAGTLTTALNTQNLNSAPWNTRFPASNNITTPNSTTTFASGLMAQMKW